MLTPDVVDQLKSQIADVVGQRVRTSRGADAAVLLRTDPARISDLRRAKLGRFSLETLIRFASRLGYEVELTLTHRPRLQAAERARRSVLGGSGAEAGKRS